MNPNHGMALPDSVQLDQVMKQQGRLQALGMAVQLASNVPEHSSSSKLLSNAKNMAHFIETGQVPAAAVKD